MNTFYFISVGVSIITNYMKTGKIEQRPVSDNKFWKEKLNDRNFLNEVYEFLASDPKKNSAELNSFLRIASSEPKENEIYLIGTKTPVNEICVRTLERFLKERGYVIYTPKEVSGYFWEADTYSPEYAKEEFVRDISLLIDRLIYVAKKKKESGYNVIFNPTGGLKAHVIACAIAGFLTGSPVYYIHEEFNEIIKLPDLFYLPKGREIELLEKLSDKEPRSGSDFKKIEAEYENEIERLEMYGLIELKYGDDGKPYRISITNKGLLFLEKLNRR